MKKILALVLALAMAFALAACGGGSSSTPSASEPASTPSSAADEGDASSAPAEEEEATQPNTGSAQVALIVGATDTIDDRGFFQSTYEGIQEFCDANQLTYTYYQPSENTEDALYEVIDLAVLNGAEVVCTTGGGFIGMMENVFAAYPDVYFICNETPFTTPDTNSIIYTFQAQESAFIAGVAAVYEGYKEIGVIGGVPILPVNRAVYGFVQGVNWAAKELGVDDINLKMWYANSLEQSPDAQAYAASWYQDGTELIAAFCGGAAISVFAAAEANNGLCIGTDVDQSTVSDTVITSNLKNVKQSTIDGLQLWLDGEFDSVGGSLLEIGLADNGMALEMENAKFNTFTQDQYDDLYQRIVDGEIQIITAEDVETVTGLWDMLEEHNVNFTFFE